MANPKGRGYGNINSVRRTLRNIHKSGMVENSIGQALESISQDISRDMAAIVPARSGRLRAMISYKLSADRLAAKIGPGAALIDVVSRFRKERIKKGAAFAPTEKRRARIKSVTDLFYFHFLDKGTKGHTVKAGKSKKVLSDGSNFYGREVNIPALPALHIKERAYDQNKAAAMAKVKAEIKKTLLKAARGGA